MRLEQRAWLISRILAGVLVLISLRVAYWQIWMGRALQPVVVDPVTSAQVYEKLRGEPSSDLSVGSRLINLAQFPQPVIQRTVQMVSTIKRGRIVDRKGNILAEDQGTPGDYLRNYSDPTLAHVIGYSSALRIGASGLEAAYNPTLLGFDRVDAEVDRALHLPSQGSDLVSTIDPDIQRVAAQGLSNRPGAVIVLDGTTGAVLAMTSAPTFDQNRLLEEGYISSLAPGTLLNRATQGLYVPGSTWKTVTMIAALDTGQVDPGTIFDFGEPKVDQEGKKYYVYEVDGGIIPDYNHQQRQLDLTMSYSYSANVTFARLADEMDPDVLIDYAARMGFSSDNFSKQFPLELPLSPSQLANDLEEIRTNNLLRASTGFGQGELLVTPLSMAMVVEAVLNEGSIPVPYFVESIRDPRGRITPATPNHHRVRGVMQARTAEQVKDIMAAWVENFGGGEKFTGGKDVVMGLKTGTAQLGGDLLPHSWIIGFVEKDGRSAVVVLFLENGGASPQLLPFFQLVSQSVVEHYLDPSNSFD